MANKEEIAIIKKDYNENHKEEKAATNKIYYKGHKEEISIINKVYRENHKEEIAANNKVYHENHKEEIAIINKVYVRERRQIDSQYKLAGNLRNRLRGALNDNQKAGSAVSDLGCSIAELKKHLESRFYPNLVTGEVMDWSNYGLYGWHIDHIKPLSKFDLSNPEQFKDACYYKNLQPLWAEDNLRKSDN
jgi:hypothetical protein